MSKFSILDCTLRDGGYYTDWDFSPALVERYLKALDGLPVDYIEVGYRAPAEPGYKGEYYYLPKSRIEWVRERAPSGTRLSVMIDEKNNTPDGVAGILGPCRELIDMVRITVAPDKIEQGCSLSAKVKELGFEVAVNLMYLSEIIGEKEPLERLARCGHMYDTLYLVDSHGAAFPDQIRTAFRMARALLPHRLGFHGHNNIELAFANALIAVEEGAEIVDSTIQGMGRGAGNLQTELLVPYAIRERNLPVDLSQLAAVSYDFDELRTHFDWGPRFPYMLSGLNRLPQKDVMALLDLRRYSTPTIIRKLQAHGQSAVISSPNLPPLADLRDVILGGTNKVAILIAGGIGARDAAAAIQSFATRENAILIHLTTTNIAHYSNVGVKQVMCLAGDEAQRLEHVADFLGDVSMFVVSDVHDGPLPPTQFSAPTTVIAIDLAEPQSEKTPDLENSPVAVAICCARELGASKIFLAGFDGYDASDNIMGAQTQEVLDRFCAAFPAIIVESLLPTRYRIPQVSVYALLA